jgi:hypothetical protein
LIIVKSVHFAFYGAEDILELGVCLDDDRSTLGARVVEHDIDAEFDEIVFFRRRSLQSGYLGRLFLLRPEAVRIFHDVVLESVEVLQHFLVLGELPPDIVHEILDDGEEEALDEVVEGLLRLALDVAHLPHHELHGVFEERPLVHQFLDLFLRDRSLFHELVELVEVDRLVLHHGSNVGTHACSGLHLYDLEAFLLDFLFKSFQHASLAILEKIDEAFPLFLIPPAFECARDTSLQITKEILHPVLQFPPFSSLQSNEHGLVGVSEVVDVTAVVQLCGMFTYLLEQSFDRRHTTGAGITRHEDIVARVLHLEAKLQGTQCAVLADDFLGGFQSLRGLHADRSGIAGPAQLFGTEFVDGCAGW